jgi:hypothetical protein
MSGSQKGPSQGRGLRKLGRWLSANRGGMLVDVLAGLLVAAVVWGVGVLAEVDFGGGVPAWAALGALLVAFVAGDLTRELRRRKRDRSKGRLERAAAEGEKATAYMEQLRASLKEGLGAGLDLEGELLLRPGELIEETTGVTVQLAILVPVDSEAVPRWHVLHRSGISQRESREFEVPLQSSYLAWIQPEWKPDEVFYLDDLHEKFASTARARDIEGFVRAGYRALRCVRIEPAEPAPISACLLVLSKEEIPGNGLEDSYLSSISRHLSAHFELVGMTKRVEALERKLGNEGPK